ncbi:NUDIX domain-containing protein [Kitasatospora sp. NPDC017646]|uniref:NUDIX domain-containing protein n=1 Tax=Kitasatospora sp. NPDC017646 TaxID=3364024 RepID=UPI003791D93A
MAAKPRSRRQVIPPDTAPPPTQVDREPAILNAVDEPLTRGFLQLPDQKSANPLALPGGLVEDGEEPETALRRELLDELGLDLAVLPAPRGGPGLR